MKIKEELLTYVPDKAAKMSPSHHYEVHTQVVVVLTSTAFLRAVILAVQLYSAVVTYQYIFMPGWKLIHPLDQSGCQGNMRGDSAEILFQSFSAGGLCQQFWHGQMCPLFDVHPAFQRPTTALPTLQGALKVGFGEAVVACNMPEPCKFPSLDSGQKKFLWTHKEADLAPHPVVGLVLQVGDTEQFPHAHGFESLDPFFRVSKQGPCSKAIECG